MRRSLDFAEVKAGARFEQILEHYGIMVSGSGKQCVALCPFHADRRPSCSIHLERKVFHCFGCGIHGTVLDFVANMDYVSIPEASIRVAEICGLVVNGLLDPERIRRNQDHCYREKLQLASLAPDPQKLDPAHPYLAERGVSPEFAAQYGLGYCNHGKMRGRICIPIHNEKGKLVAYAGRFASRVVPKGVMKYHLPAGFEKRRVLFGLHRMSGANHIVLVEGYWSVFRL